MFLWSAIQAAKGEGDGNGGREHVACGNTGSYQDHCEESITVNEHIRGCSLGK